MTPLSAQRTKSATSTPAQEPQQQAKGGDRLRQKLFFAPLIEEMQTQSRDIEPSLPTSPLRLHGIGSKEGEKGDGEGGIGDGEGDVGDREGGMGDLFGEELGNLQEANCDLQKQLEVVFCQFLLAKHRLKPILMLIIAQLKESQLLQMNARQAELESRVLEITRLYENEQESAKNQEQLLRDKLTQLSSEKVQLEGDKTGRMKMQRVLVLILIKNDPLSCAPLLMVVLADEIQDLKLCLKSADRELVEVKTELRQETEEAKNKSAELYLRVCFLHCQLKSLPSTFLLSQWSRLVN